MKLKEKFVELEVTKGLSKECEKISDDYAIKFSDWVNVNAYKHPTSTTTKELLEIFKKNNSL